MMEGVPDGETQAQEVEEEVQDDEEAAPEVVDVNTLFQMVAMQSKRKLPKAAPDENVDLHQIRTIYKGRKYNWQAKVNFHIHIVQHVHMDTTEVIAYNTATLLEAPHIFVPTSLVLSKIKVEVNETIVLEVRKEYAKMNIEPPLPEAIEEVLRRNAIAAYILDRITVTVHPAFTIDVRDYEKSYRMAVGERAIEKLSAVNAEWTAGEKSDTGTTTTTTTTTAVVVQESTEDSETARSQWDKDSLAASVLGAPDQRAPNLENAASTTITHQKPRDALETYIRRIGKSTTLIGEVGYKFEKVSKLDKLLAALVANHSSAAVPKISKNIMNRISLLNKKHRTRVLARKQTSAFHKFRNDEDLLAESLSFVHISDFMSLQGVCKLWRKVVSGAMQNVAQLVVYTRDLHMREMPLLRLRDAPDVGYVAKKIVVEEPKEGIEAATLPSLTPNAQKDRFKWRNVFTLAETLTNVLNRTTKNLLTLKLHYVVLNKDLIVLMGKHSTRLRELSLGIIKIDDSPLQAVAESTKAESPRHSQAPHPPVQSTRLSQVNKHDPAHRQLSTIAETHHETPTVTWETTVVEPAAGGKNFGRNILNARRAQHEARHAPPPRKVTEKKFVFPEIKASPHNPVNRLRYMHGEDVKLILRACGGELTHLELSVTIGPIPQEAFQYTPKLVTLSAMDTIVAPTVRCKTRMFDGFLPPEDLVSAMTKISMASLLALMADSPHEAMLLTDKKGRVCVANEAWEKLTGYRTGEVAGFKLDFLRGELTDPEEFERLDEAIIQQVTAVSLSTLLYRPDGQAYLAQLIFVPNVAKYGGNLDATCLSQAFLEDMALQEAEEELLRSGQRNSYLKQRNMKDFISGLKHISYHYIRFGCLSEPFQPVVAGVVDPPHH